MIEENQQHKILLVEDDASLASMVADFLRQRNYAVTIEGRGDAAVDRIRSENPDVVSWTSHFLAWMAFPSVGQFETTTMAPSLS